MTLPDSLRQAIEAYDEATNRSALAAKVKQLRAQGVNANEFREYLDANGIPRRFEVLADGVIQWSYDRTDTKPAQVKLGPRERKGPSVEETLPGWDDDDDGPSLGRSKRFM